MNKIAFHKRACLALAVPLLLLHPVAFGADAGDKANAAASSSSQQKDRPAAKSTGAKSSSEKPASKKSAASGPTPGSEAHKNRMAKADAKKKLDRSGNARQGKASFYADSFHGQTMADGTPMNANENIAASRTLPLGTKAEVTNLENGKTEVVEIRDRGPYIDGRIIDLSPKVADKLDMTEDGVAPVVVKPIEVPQADGSIKPGVAAETSSGR